MVSGPNHKIRIVRTRKVFETYQQNISINQLHYMLGKCVWNKTFQENVFFFRKLVSLKLIKRTQKIFDATQVLPHSAGHPFRFEDMSWVIWLHHSDGSILKTSPGDLTSSQSWLNVMIWTHDHSQSGLRGGGWTGGGGEDSLHTIS